MFYVITSKTSMLIILSVALGFFSPDTSMATVWLPGASPVFCNVTNEMLDLYRSTSPILTPSRYTLALPIFGPFATSHLIPVPLKVNSALAPVCFEYFSEPPLQEGQVYVFHMLLYLIAQSSSSNNTLETPILQQLLHFTPTFICLWFNPCGPVSSKL